MTTIEDVDYMLKHSEMNSITFFLDSAKRNKSLWPTPHEYTIDFEAPLRNVCGIEVVDAAIPASMWNVDYNNDILAFSQILTSQTYTTNEFISYFNELEYNNAFNLLFNAVNNTLVYIFTNRTNYDNVIATTHTISIQPTPYAFFIRNTVTDHSIHLNTGILVSELASKYTFMYQGKSYYMDIDDAYIDIIKNGDFHIWDDVILVYYEHTYVTIDAATNQLSEFNPETAEFAMVLYNQIAYLERGNYSITTLSTYLAQLMQSIYQSNLFNSIENRSQIVLEQPNEFGDFTKQSRIKWSGGEMPFLLDMKKSTCDELLGFSTESTVLEGSSYTKLSHVNNKYLFLSCTDNNLNNYIISPGIVNLLGVRFLLLRIPEIENHLLSSFAYSKYSPGVALMKLASGNDVTHLRFDFVNLVKRPFHPIGKLTRLTIRFELANGQFYDFKGVDHNFLVVVKYYAPKAPASHPMKYTLNPNYLPNFIEYQNKYLMRNDDETDDSNNESDENDHDADILRLYLQRKKYDYNPDLEL